MSDFAEDHAMKCALDGCGNEVGGNRKKYCSDRCSNADYDRRRYKRRCAEKQVVVVPDVKCARPGCEAMISPVSGKRRRKYCSPRCQDIAYKTTGRAAHSELVERVYDPERAEASISRLLRYVDPVTCRYRNPEA